MARGRRYEHDGKLNAALVPRGSIEAELGDVKEIASEVAIDVRVADEEEESSDEEEDE